MQQQLKIKGGKNIRALRERVDANKYYSMKEAITIIKESSYPKFDQTLDLIIKLGVDPKHSDQLVRGIVVLPAGTGKVTRVAVICKDDKIELAKEAGADLVNATDIIESIKAGKIDFDSCIATPDMMTVVGQVARILGPKGLMPNPKLGTVTQDIATAVKNAKKGQVEFRVEKNGIVHVGTGKISFSIESLSNNVQAVIEAVNKSKPSGAKGVYMKAVFLSATMGPAFKIDMTSTPIITN